MLAEAAHSWADAGNEFFLLMANRLSLRPADRAYPLGHGREAYVWSLFAALGLFVAGAAVSVTHGVQQLVTPEPAGDFVVGYVVLGISFVLEGVSFLRSVHKQGRGRVDAARPHRARSGHLRSHAARGGRGEDAAALIGL